MANDADPTIFTLASKSLKLDDANSLTPHISALSDPSTAAQIKSLDLSGNTIGVPAAQHLATLLPTLKSLETASLADIFTSRLLSEIPPALEALLTALLECPKLTHVNLSDNAFGLNTAAPLVKYLEKATTLRHLILNNNGLGPEAGKLVAGALARLAEAKRKQGAGQAQFLETIVCGRNRLENGSALAWSEALKLHSPDLKEVRMSQNGIRVEGMSAILAGLGAAAGLEVLDIQDNLMTVPGAKALCKVLPGWKGLRELQISDTLLKRRGGVLLMQTLAKGQNEKLQVLRCQYNEIDVEAIKILADALEEQGKLPELRRLDVNGNKFLEDDAPVESLASIFSDRKQKASPKDKEDLEWGLDELDELEEPSDEEDEEEEEEDEDKGVDESTRAKVLQDADEEEAEIVSQKKDADVDALADRLGKTDI